MKKLFLFGYLVFLHYSVHAMELVPSWPNPFLPSPDAGADQVFHAARYGNADLIRHFLSKDVNTIDSKGYSSLHYACVSGGIEAVKTLINEFSAQVNVKNCHGKVEFSKSSRRWKGKIATPLHCAVTAGNVDTIAFLLGAGAEINSDYQQDGSTPLHLAAWFNFPAVVRLLIDNGAGLNRLNICGSSPVHSAAWRNSIESLKILLDRGAEFTQRNYTGQGNTPLYLAVKAGSIQCLRMLLARDLNRKENVSLHCATDNSTPLEVAVMRDRYQCFWDLICAGARLDCLNKRDLLAQLDRRAMLKKFLEEINSWLDVTGDLTLDAIRLDKTFISCDMCSEDYQNNNVVLCLPCDHTFHDACFQEACWDKYYAKNIEHSIFKNMPKKEAKFKINLEMTRTEFVDSLEICPKPGCNCYLSSFDKQHCIMKIYNPILDK